MSLNELVAFAEPVKPEQFPAEKLKSWELLGRGKMVLDTGLQTRAMSLQMHLKVYKPMDAAAITLAVKNKTLDVNALTLALANYKRDHVSMIEYRKSFTKFLDNCVAQCMTVEKQYDPKTNPEFIAAATLELDARKAASAIEQDESAKNTEIANFKAHVINSYYTSAAKYRGDLAQIIFDTHKSCLIAKTPFADVPAAIATAKLAFRDVRPSALPAFQFIKISADEAKTIQDAVPKPNWKEIWDQSLKALSDKFLTYESDLAARSVIIQQETLNFEAEQTQQQQEIANTVAANQLLAAAQSHTVQTNTVKPIAKKKSIKIVTDDQDWVVKIQSAFISNFTKCFPKLKNSDYSKITIGQQAAALDAAKVTVEGVDYVETEK